MSDPAIDEQFWSHYPSILHPNDFSRQCLHGFSGSVVWKIATELGHVAVRRFPSRKPPGSTLGLRTLVHERPPLDHHELTRARLYGWNEVPQPLPNNDGETFTMHDDSWWDVCSWQPGEPVKLPIDGPHLREAMHFIARWHSFWTKQSARFDSNDIHQDAVGRRIEEWRRLWRIDWSTQGLWGNRSNDPLGLAGRAFRAVKARARVMESHLHQLPLLLSNEPKVFCHGDLHREHILFTDGKPTGLIDLSCRWDYAAADLARWLFTTTEANRWTQAAEWYREVAPLSAASERAIPMLAETGLVIAALRWEKWLLGIDPERRYFPRPDLAYDRWRMIVERLEGEML
jgi:Ser/Thr protein kinase RdoA (MazF antagonist)